MYKHLLNKCGPKCDISEKEAWNYVTGTPTIIHRDDFRELAPIWKTYTELLYNDISIERGGWMVDMYGYILASIHLGLKHQVRRELSVTNAMWDNEWKDITAGHMTIHYCQAVEIGNWKFYKHEWQNHEQMLNCSNTPSQFPLPPVYPEGEKRPNDKYLTQQSFLAWTLIFNLNKAILEYRKFVCKIDTNYFIVNDPEKGIHP